jgi:hypothetical protein
MESCLTCLSSSLLQVYRFDKDKIVLNSIDANEPDVSDYHYLPDIAKLSEKLRSCLQVL